MLNTQRFCVQAVIGEARMFPSDFYRQQCLCCMLDKKAYMHQSVQLINWQACHDDERPSLDSIFPDIHSQLTLSYQLGLRLLRAHLVDSPIFHWVHRRVVVLDHDTRIDNPYSSSVQRSLHIRTIEWLVLYCHVLLWWFAKTVESGAKNWTMLIYKSIKDCIRRKASFQSVSYLLCCIGK